MASDNSSPTPHCLRKYQEMMEIFAIRASMHLGIFDALPTDRDPHVPIEQLAGKTGADSSLVQRFLRVLVGCDLVDYVAVDHYRNTKDSMSYRVGQPSATVFTLMYNEGLVTSTFFLDWLATQERSRAPQGKTSHTHNPHTFRAGREGTPSFDVLSRDQNRLQLFQDGLALLDVLHPFLGSYDFARIGSAAHDDRLRTCLVDVGGGNGRFVEMLLREHPSIRPELTVVQDIPCAIDLARANDNLPPGVRCMEHDFFRSQPETGARIYHIRACLHDYSDELCVDILTNIAGAMAPDSKLLIAENVKPPIPELGESIGSMDLLMMLWGGKERTRDNFVSILDAAGLQLDAAYPSEKPPWTILETSLKSTILEVQ